MITIIGLLIGILVFGAGLYYLFKDKEDKEAKKIYTVTAVIGLIIAVVAVLRILFVGI